MVEGAMGLVQVGRGVQGCRGVENGVLKPVVHVFHVLWTLVVRRVPVSAPGVVVVAYEGFRGVRPVVHQRQLEKRLYRFIKRSNRKLPESVFCPVGVDAPGPRQRGVSVYLREGPAVLWPVALEVKHGNSSVVR